MERHLCIITDDDSIILNEALKLLNSHTNAWDKKVEIATLIKKIIDSTRHIDGFSLIQCLEEVKEEEKLRIAYTSSIMGHDEGFIE